EAGIRRGEPSRPAHRWAGREPPPDCEHVPGRVETVHFAGLEVDEALWTVWVVDDRQRASARGVEAGREQRSPFAAPDSEVAVRRALPHGSGDRSPAKCSLEDDLLWAAGELKPYAGASSRGRDRLYSRVPETKRHDSSAPRELERDRVRSAERVRADPPAREGRTCLRVARCKREDAGGGQQDASGVLQHNAPTQQIYRVNALSATAPIIGSWERTGTCSCSLRRRHSTWDK